MKLYRYINYNPMFIEDQLNGLLWASRIREFNDPFEGDFHYTTKTILKWLRVKGNLAEEFKQGIEHGVLPVDKQMEILKNEMIDNYFATCFSDQCDNGLMWSYYADGHKGIVLGYDLDPCAVEINQRKSAAKLYELNKYAVHKISYTGDRLTIDDNMLDNPDAAFEMFAKKHKMWINESEYRIIFNWPNSGEKGFVFSINNCRPRQIFFGLKTPRDVIDEIKRSCVKTGLRCEFETAAIIRGMGQLMI